MKGIFLFDTMLTPKLVTGIYWLLLLISLVSGVMMMFPMLNYGFFSFEIFLKGSLTIFGGAIGARIWCELMIVVFKINESLQVLKDAKVKPAE